MAPTEDTVREGLIVGFVAYVVVAVFYIGFDVLAARGTFFTLDLLGQVVFQGLRDPATLQLPMDTDVSAMVAYNSVHLALSLAVGVFVASLVARVEERPSRGYSVLVILLGGYLITIVGVGMFVRGVAPLLPFWTIVLVNTLAAVAGGLYLARAHPTLAQRVGAVARDKRG